METGVAVVQEEGGPPQVLGPGPRVFCAPGARHWHGAAPTTTITQLAIAVGDGSYAARERQVTDEEYLPR